MSTKCLCFGVEELELDGRGKKYMFRIDPVANTLYWHEETKKRLSLKNT